MIPHWRYGAPRASLFKRAAFQLLADRQASKQADVLMLGYLFSPSELQGLFDRLGHRVDEDLWRRTADYYLARHGATLSSLVHAWVPPPGKASTSTSSVTRATGACGCVLGAGSSVSRCRLRPLPHRHPAAGPHGAHSAWRSTRAVRAERRTSTAASQEGQRACGCCGYCGSPATRAPRCSTSRSMAGVSVRVDILRRLG
jgi:hypothetical protein